MQYTDIHSGLPPILSSSLIMPGSSDKVHKSSTFYSHKPSTASISSVDTDDLMDHRQSQQFSSTYTASTDPFFQRRRRSSHTFPQSSLDYGQPTASNTSSNQPGPPEQHKHSGVPTSSFQSRRRRTQSFSSPSLYERMVSTRKAHHESSEARGPNETSSSSRAPLLSTAKGKINEPMPSYDSIPDHIHRDHDMLAINIDNLDGNAKNTQDTYRHFMSADGHHESGSFGDSFDNIDEESILGSKPASRRSSSASSLGDVCLPIDSPPENASGFDGTRGCHFDLSYLEEFATIERKELLEISQATPAESILNNSSKNMTSMPGVNQLVSHAVNEIDGDTHGRLRPHRVVPWENRKSTINGLSGTGGYSTGFVDANNRNKDSFGKRVKHRHHKQQQQQFNYPIIEDTLMRFTYFREDLEATIHSPSISGLLQPGQRFNDLFDVDYYSHRETTAPTTLNMSAKSVDIPLSPLAASPLSTDDGKRKSTEATPPVASRESNTPINEPIATPNNGIEPSPFWLDVLNPTEEEMKVLSKTFGIHPLTTEDIFLGETREKVELFRNYYLVCFRSFDIHDERSKSKDQSAYAEDSGISGSGTSRRKKKKNSSELTPLNMYIIVFHEGVITFHFSPTPHPVNVRRRTRLLRDYITVSSDWISYALIDDITDGFAPMIDAIDDEVTWIEDSILRMHSGESDSDDSDDEDEKISRRGSIMTKAGSTKQRSSSSSSSSSSYSSSLATKDGKWKEKGDMLRRIGECRKRIMSILRLLGSKADVIKGFSKRCNEQWEVAPRSEIGLYLGDIQDHIVTMVQSLNHYEKLLLRAHSNYLAQLNIDMTRVNNDMNDVLSRINVLGTIVLPMNIVTGLWGMNVFVPGQNIESLTWFWGITSSLFAFAIICFLIARRIYGIA